MGIPVKALAQGPPDDYVIDIADLANDAID